MRIIALLLIVTVITESAASQATRKKPANREIPSQNEATSKSQILSQMNGATDDIKKEIGDLETQMKTTSNPEEKKSLQEQINMLKKQVSAMGGLTKNISNLSDKTIKEAVEQSNDDNTVPKKDNSRINALPKKTFTAVQLKVESALLRATVR